MHDDTPARVNSRWIATIEIVIGALWALAFVAAVAIITWIFIEVW